MDNTTSQIILDLDNLLNESLSIHTISFEFDKISEVIRKQKIKFKIRQTRKYYFDAELDDILQIRKSTTLPLQEVVALREKELLLLDLKDEDETTKIRVEPSKFEYQFPLIIAYLDKSNKKEKLIADLIESYNLIY